MCGDSFLCAIHASESYCCPPLLPALNIVHESTVSPWLQELLECVQVFFKKWRHKPKSERSKPVMVHINYHPNKVERMKAIVEYYKTGNEKAIMQFPGGSEPGS